jgi:hypothetical protein
MAKSKKGWSLFETGSEAAAFEERFKRLLALLGREGGDGKTAALAEMGGSESEAARNMVGAWFVEKTRAINDGLRGIALDDPDERAAWVGRAAEVFEELGDLASAMRSDSFKEFARFGLGFNEREANVLAAEIEAMQDFSIQLAQPLAAEDAGELRFGPMRESPDWRRVVKSRSAHAGELAKLDGGSYFSPLLDCIANEASPTLRAEMTAKMELYIQSGHARNDCLTPREGASHAAKRMRSLCAALRDSPEKAGNAKQIINSRFNELFLKINVVQKVGGNGEIYSEAASAGKSSTKEGHHSETGTVDAVIRDAKDPTKLHAAVVTADETTFVESDQLLRHTTALKRAVAQGAIEGAKSVGVSFYAPSIIYGTPTGKLRELSDLLLSSLKDDLNPAQRQAINVLPSLSCISRVDRNHPHFPVDSLADVELRLIGGSASSWNQDMATVRRIKDPAERSNQFLSAVAERLSEAIDIFSNTKGAEAKMRAGSSNRAILASFCECLEGLNKHALDHPEIMRGIESKAGALQGIRDHLSKESEVRGRLSGIIDAYDYPGGYSAWAQKRLDRESGRALGARGTQADYESHLARSLGAELGTKGGFDLTDSALIREALKTDESKALGLSGAEKRALDSLLKSDPGAARDLLRERATETLHETAATARVQDLHFLVRLGADATGVGSQGLDPAGQARKAGRTDAAAYLDVAKEKQGVERVLAHERMAREAERRHERLKAEAPGPARKAK